MANLMEPQTRSRVLGGIFLVYLYINNNNSCVVLCLFFLKQLQEYFEFPPSGPEISDKAHSFITGLICEREIRLGRKGSSDFRSHPFFCGIDWNSLNQLSAPFLPDVSNATDTSNFDILDDSLSEMVYFFRMLLSMSCVSVKVMVSSGVLHVYV